MLFPVAGLIDLQGAPHQRLGLPQPVRGMEQRREVVEVTGHVRMLFPVAGLIDLQGPPHQRLSLSVE